MSQYRDRVGQRIGSLEVEADHGRTRRPRNGGRKVLWRCIDHRDGSVKVLRTDQIIKLSREVGGEIPDVAVASR